MKQKVYQSCTSCPAALVCRSAGIHYTHICTECGRPWILLLLDSVSSYYFAVILSSKNCEDVNLLWQERRLCPTCRDIHGHPPLGRSYKKVHVFDADFTPQNSDRVAVK